MLQEGNKLRSIYPVDVTDFILIFSNLLTLFFAIKNGWSVLILMWIYWFQSLIIGFFQILKIYTIKEFSVDKLEINGHPANPTEGTRYFTMIFFTIHYGIFHFGYFMFLIFGGVFEFALSSGTGFSNILASIALILISASVFFINHLISFIIHNPHEKLIKKNIGTMLFFPYVRIVPMHLMAMFGFFFIHTKVALIVFIILKTLADLFMHRWEHMIKTQNMQ